VEGAGLAKTLAVKTLGQVLDLHFARIQFTPDPLPADLIGTMIYQQKTVSSLPGGPGSRTCAR
jgi:MoxR-like ATPase